MLKKLWRYLRPWKIQKELEDMTWLKNQWVIRAAWLDVLVATYKREQDLREKK